MNSCPVCQRDMTRHTDKDCITSLLNRIKKLEKIAKLCAQEKYHPTTLEVHRELMAALRAAGYGE